MNTEAWLLNWNEAFTAGSAACGGKGWNLARLSRYGFPVPAGGVLVARIYFDHLDQCLEPKEREWLQGLDADSVTQEPAASHLQRFRERILTTPLPMGVEGALTPFIQQNGEGHAAWAIRSSAVAEDGEHHSFAGIHESVLNVPGQPEALCNAVRRCYASLWTPQAVAYRRHARIADAECGCAVVFCRMIHAFDEQQPKAAGVLFTADPLNGRRDQAIVNSVAGLADQLVAGAQTPVQSKVTTHLLSYRIVPQAAQAETMSPVEDHVLVELARWGMRAQWALGEGDLPQDIEWAYDGRQLWVLQSRPVTRLPHRSFEPLASLPVIWSNANLKEVVSGLPTTLSWSLIQDAVRDLLFTPLQAVGFPIPEGMPLLRRFHGRAYFDLSALQWAYYDCFGYPPEQLNRELGGNQPAVPTPSDNPMKGAQGRPRQRRQLRALFALKGIGKRLAKAHEETLSKVVAFRECSLEALDDGELRVQLQEWRAYGTPLTHLFQFANSDAGVWLKFSRDLLTWLDPDGGEALLGKLLTAGGHMPSAEALHRLNTLAELAATDPAAHSWLHALHQGETEISWQQLPPESPFRLAFEEYLRDYGHRALNETELASPRWYEDPDALVKEIARQRATVPETTGETALARRLEAEQEIARLPWWSRPLVRALAARARRGMSRREIGKSLTVAVLEPVRKIALEVGRRLTQRNRLQHPGEVFQLALADLDAFLAGTWDGTGAEDLVRDRTMLRQIWERESVPDVIIEGDEAILHQQPSLTTILVTGEPLWSGIGVSPGEALGRARVLHTPEEGARFGKGEILVAATTDTGWTPLFLRAGGIVTEIGGYLSHGAIVARELGIPAVVNLTEALSRLADEPTIRMDGAKGTVSATSKTSGEPRAPMGDTLDGASQGIPISKEGKAK